ncbi:hypothetical protein BASA83_001207 [Batrachochytrium salamandrivorans]|nr:hypothetical protein BASA81_007269 [Batrachochytrium salamandrivorans]KAH9276502.1 hypothetical protein BASA83_001207 [Batrachochytrium salamandrivorans]
MSLSDPRSRTLLARLVQLAAVAQFYTVYSDHQVQAQSAIPDFLSVVAVPQCLDSASSDARASSTNATHSTTKRVSTHSGSTAALDLEADTVTEVEDSVPETNASASASTNTNTSLRNHHHADLKKPAALPVYTHEATPSLAVAFYSFVLRRLPTLVDAQVSSDYLSHVDLNVPLTVMRKVAVATRTDVLFLIMHFTSLIVDIFNDECCIAEHSSSAAAKMARLSHNTSEICDLQTPPPDDLLIWQGIYCQQLWNKSFDASRPLVTHPVLDRTRMNKAMRFMNVIRTSFRSAFRAVHHIHLSELVDDEYKKKVASKTTGSSSSSNSSSNHHSSEPYVPIYWRQISEAPSYKDLPPPYVELMNLVPMLIAYILDNILDHVGRLQKVCVIISKLPVSLIIISLRFINPAPLIERMLRLFLWQPTRGMYSLLQKLGAHLCAFDATLSEYQTCQLRIDVHRAGMISRVAETTHAPSRASVNELHAILAENGVGDATEDEVRFFLVGIRRNEKKEFIDSLAAASTVHFVIHAAHLVPMILEDLRKYGDLASIVGQFFEALHKTTTSLQRYSDYKAHTDHETSGSDKKDSETTTTTATPKPATGDEKKEKPRYDQQLDQLSQDIVTEIEIAWQGFLQTLFPVLHKLGKAAATGSNSILVRVVDWIMTSIVGYVATCNDVTGEAKVDTRAAVMLERVLARLTEAEQSAVWAETDEMLQLGLSGLDQRLWPNFPLINGKVSDYFTQEIVGILNT